MPNIKNKTIFPNFRFYSTDNLGKDFGSIIVKATFDIDKNGQLILSEEQAPMLFTDECFGEVNVTSLWHPSDLVAQKATTDLIINARAWAPQGISINSWICGLSIHNENYNFDKYLHVTGPRQWLPQWQRELTEKEKNDWNSKKNLFLGWQLSEADPIVSLPIRYEYAFGDIRQNGLDKDGNATYEDSGYNPLGCGWLHPEWSNHTIPHKAPQIEAVGDPILKPYKKYLPQGLGPIPPAWEPRLSRAGTFDDYWETNIWPNWPRDYKFSFNNSANDDLIMEGFLTGNEVILLKNLRPEAENFSINLPNTNISIIFIDYQNNISCKQMNLDTIFLDIADENLENCHVYLSWRIRFEPDFFKQAIITIDKVFAENGGV